MLNIVSDTTIFNAAIKAHYLKEIFSINNMYYDINDYIMSLFLECYSWQDG